MDADNRPTVLDLFANIVGVLFLVFSLHEFVTDEVVGLYTQDESFEEFTLSFFDHVADELQAPRPERHSGWF